MTRLGALFTLFVAATQVAGEQRESDLALSAAKEKSRREGLQARGRSYGDDDLRAPVATGAQQQVASPGATQPASSAASAERPRGRNKEQPELSTPEEAPLLSEPASLDDADAARADWRERAARGREALSGALSKLAALEERKRLVSGRLNPMNTTFATDPFEVAELQTQLQELEGQAGPLRAELERAQADWRAFEELARRSRVPPRWLEAPEP